MTKIKIVKANIEWVKDFYSIAKDIRMLLGDIAIRIDHIGSTSVPNLSAKDVIDIQISVYSIQDCTIVNKMIRAGYIYKSLTTHDNLMGLKNDSPELQKKYFREKLNHRKAHIHIRELGRINQIYPLVFRDYLRNDDEARLAYETIKQELALRFPYDSIAYYAIKDPIMDIIYKAAKLWSVKFQWQTDENFL